MILTIFFVTIDLYVGTLDGTMFDKVSTKKVSPVNTFSFLSQIKRLSYTVLVGDRATSGRISLSFALLLST